MCCTPSKGSQSTAKLQPASPCGSGVSVNLDVYVKSPSFHYWLKFYLQLYTCQVEYGHGQELIGQWPLFYDLFKTTFSNIFPRMLSWSCSIWNYCLKRRFCSQITLGNLGSRTKNVQKIHHTGFDSPDLLDLRALFPMNCMNLSLSPCSVGGSILGNGGKGGLNWWTSLQTIDVNRILINTEEEIIIMLLINSFVM